ncbi:DUF3221 domain-containing protein [Metabacillus fastidiosus]|uniref:DUF3221 domain-containing protein n=1 Tax=Metabacillus fastidiosus TaxID=1458 RepID=UPI002E21A56C|nr:DUF3221 domain-containing protein [Metabacillus fastidiosus]
MRKIKSITIMILIVLIIAGCGEGKRETEGYILKVEEERILFAENISFKEYTEMKDLSVDELTSLEPVPNLIYLSYNKTGDFKKGDKVSVTILGNELTSLPGQAKASKIKKVE